MRRFIDSLVTAVRHGALVAGVSSAFIPFLEQSAALVTASMLLGGQALVTAAVCQHLPAAILLVGMALFCFRSRGRLLPGETAASDPITSEDSELTPTAEPLVAGFPLNNTTIRLSLDGAVETVLDLDTGRELRREVVSIPPTPGCTEPENTEDDVEPEENRDAPLFGTMLSLLEDAGFKTLYLARPPLVWACQWGEAGTYSLQFMAREEASTIICRTRLPIRIPARLRWRAMEFVTRANEQLIAGAFELSLDDGDMWFRGACILGEDGVPTASMVAALAGVGIEMSDLYVPLLLDALYGKRAVAESVTAALSA